MKALYFNGKEVKLVRDYPTPKNDSEALIKVVYAGICRTDLEIIKGYSNFKGVLGHEFVGIVEESPIKELEGLRVVGEINCGCGECVYCNSGIVNHCPNRTVLGISGRDGSFAEYISLPVSNLHVVPESIPDKEAVFVEPLAACFRVLEQIHLLPTHKVLVLGDGKLGLLLAQVLKLPGCSVTIAGKHEKKMSILKNYGVRTVLVDELARERVYDVVIDATGSEMGLELCSNLVKPTGKIVLKTTVAGSMSVNMSKYVVDEITIVGSRCGPFKPALEALSDKRISVSKLIDAIYPIDNGISALRHASKPGTLKVLISPSS